MTGVVPASGEGVVVRGTADGVVEVARVAAVKLFVHPLLVLGAGLAARAAGFDVPAYGLTVLVLASALPSASNVSMLAERHGADNGRVARIIMASTVLSFATFSGFAALMRQ